MQCGQTCLRMICTYYGKDYSSEYLSKLCFATNEGVSMFGISYAAERLGLNVKCGRLAIDDLDKIHLPCILHWNQNHFVVLYRIGRNMRKFYIADPAKGRITCSRADMERHWVSMTSDGKAVGIAMTLVPTPDFRDQLGDLDVNSGESRSLSFLFGYVKCISAISGI